MASKQRPTDRSAEPSPTKNSCSGRQKFSARPPDGTAAASYVAASDTERTNGAARPTYESRLMVQVLFQAVILQQAGTAVSPPSFGDRRPPSSSRRLLSAPPGPKGNGFESKLRLEICATHYGRNQLEKSTRRFPDLAVDVKPTSQGRRVLHRHTVSSTVQPVVVVAQYMYMHAVRRQPGLAARPLSCKYECTY